jgi:hypothetical protein
LIVTERKREFGQFYVGLMVQSLELSEKDSSTQRIHDQDVTTEVENVVLGLLRYAEFKEWELVYVEALILELVTPS